MRIKNVEIPPRSGARLDWLAEISSFSSIAKKNENTSVLKRKESLEYRVDVARSSCAIEYQGEIRLGPLGLPWSYHLLPAGLSGRT